MKIDSHHHLWNYSAEEYGWIDDSMQALRRDFLPEDIKREIDAVGIDGVVTVQARQSTVETGWLLDFADKNDFILGVVGWVDLRGSSVTDQLEQFAPHPKLKAVRHVVQDEPDNDFILGEDFNAGISLLKNHGLVYDILIYERQLAPSVQFVDRHPDQPFVLDHIAKPQIDKNLMDPWQAHIREMAKRQNVTCKISGMVTEADHQAWTPEQLLPYLETTLEAFGPKRVMFGSDWPVCLLACEYDRWHQIVSDFANSLSETEQASLFGGTAVQAYGLENSN